MKRTVLGCLPYLNVRPLIRSIERDVPPGYELIYTVPSNLARRLENGTCDIAAVSSFEATVAKSSARNSHCLKS